MRTKSLLLCLIFPIVVLAEEPMARSEASSSTPSLSSGSRKMSASENLFGPTRNFQGVKPLTDKNGKNVGEVRLTVEDWKGEPVARDVFIKVEVKCAGLKSFKTATPAYNTCAFLGLEHDRERENLVIHYNSPTVIDGRFGCDSKASQREFKISCKN